MSQARASNCYSSERQWDSTDLPKNEQPRIDQLPTWAKAAKVEDGRAQPWKKWTEVADDPNFADGKDLSLHYKTGVAMSAMEGMLAG